jgi:hypothetical protein
MLRVVLTCNLYAPHPVTHLSGQEPVVFRVSALDLSNYLVTDMSSCHPATTRRTPKDVLPVAPVERQGSHVATSCEWHFACCLPADWAFSSRAHWIYTGSMVEVPVRQLFN